jgi:Na+/H+-dicarboxylate symporter
VPAEGVGLLLAVDAIPDAARTLTNVTGHLAITAIVGRSEMAGAHAAESDTTTAVAADADRAR